LDIHPFQHEYLCIPISRWALFDLQAGKVAGAKPDKSVNEKRLQARRAALRRRMAVRARLARQALLQQQAANPFFQPAIQPGVQPAIQPATR